MTPPRGRSGEGGAAGRAGERAEERIGGRAGAAARGAPASVRGHGAGLAGRWRRFWENAPRQLRFTRAGRVLVGLALGTGFAAINTGNNLLFLGWGLVLSAIALSGILSESVLRTLALRSGPAGLARVGVPVHLPLVASNGSRVLPAFGVELVAEFEEPGGGVVEAAAPFQLQIEPAGRRALRARLVPARRGRHSFACLRARTTYPFGFFEKSRRYEAAGELWAAPAAVPVDDVLPVVLAVLGDAPARRPGPGDDLFGLRPYRSGDDPRRIAHRRSAKTGRWIVRETEATVGGAVLLVLRLEAASGESVERALAGTASLAEALLARGRTVGILGPGTFVSPDHGEGQRQRILLALARLDPALATPPLLAPLPALGATRVELVPRPQAPSGIAVVLPPGAAGGHADFGQADLARADLARTPREAPADVAPAVVAPSSFEAPARSRTPSSLAGGRR